jgi:hypothetical protein
MEISGPLVTVAQLLSNASLCMATNYLDKSCYMIVAAEMAVHQIAYE